MNKGKSYSISYLQYLRDKVVSIAQLSGNVVLRFYNNNLELFEKADGSFYTKADIESEKLILRELKKLTPEIPVISEEAIDQEVIPSHIKKGSFWLVDPLDGTDGYIKGNDDFVINIALISNFSPILGVIYLPTSRKIYSGIAGEGAYVTGRDGNISKIQAKVVSPKRLTLLLYHPLPKNIHRSRYLKKVPFKKVSRSSDSRRFCRMAEGEFDLHICFEGCYEWDIAAGHAIIKGSGGNIIGLNNLELVYGKKAFKNPAFIVHGKLNRYRIPCFAE